jgi:hypothetical protein
MLFFIQTYFGEPGYGFAFDDLVADNLGNIQKPRYPTDRSDPVDEIGQED